MKPGAGGPRLLRLAAFVLLVATVLLYGLDALGTSAATQAGYTIVLRNGRVLDPESGLDAVRNVAIAGRTIAAISEQPLRGHDRD